MVTRLGLSIALVVLMCRIAAAQWAFQVLHVPSPRNPAVPMQARTIVDDHTLALDTATVGVRLLQSSTTPTLVTCAVQDFALRGQEGREGPQIHSMNNGLIVAGTAVNAADGKSYGLLQYPDGHCEATLAPGSDGTIFHDLTDTGTVYGWLWNPGGNLLRYDGFVKTGATITILRIPGEPNTRVFPTKADPAGSGNFTGYAYRSIGVDNTYTFQGFVFVSGQYRFIDYPTGEDVKCVGWGGSPAAPKVLCLVLSSGGTEKDAVVYDVQSDTFTLLPKPPGTILGFTPRAMNRDESFVGSYIEQPAQVPGAPEPPPVVRQFLALKEPSVQVASAASSPKPSLRKLYGWKAWRMKPLWQHRVPACTDVQRHAPLCTDAAGKITLVRTPR